MVVQRVEGRLRLGDLCVRVKAADRELMAPVLRAFRRTYLELAGGHESLSLELDWGPVLLSQQASGSDHFLTHGIEARFYPQPFPGCHLTIPRGRPAEAVEHAVVVVVHRLLLLQSCVYIHAGGVLLNGIGRMFLGPSGSGKSTCCLSLVARGGQLLSDDHLLLRLEPDGVGMSGSEGASRLDERSEAWLFPAGLPYPARAHGERFKKELPPEGYGRWLAHRQVPVNQLFLCRRSERFRCSPAFPARATMTVIEQLRYALRQAGPEDGERLLNLTARLVHQAEVFDLELSDDLGQMSEWCENL
jgi:hypothetical protein